MYKNYYAIALAVAGGFVLANLVNGQDTKGNYTNIAKSETIKKNSSEIAMSSRDVDSLSGLQYYTPNSVTAKRSSVDFLELEAIQYAPYTPKHASASDAKIDSDNNKKALMSAKALSSLKNQLASEFEDLTVIYKAKKSIAGLDAIQYEPVIRKVSIEKDPRDFLELEAIQYEPVVSKVSIENDPRDFLELEGIQYEPLLKSSSSKQKFSAYKKDSFGNFVTSTDLASLKSQLSSSYESVKNALKNSASDNVQVVWEFEGISEKPVWEFEGVTNNYSKKNAALGLDDLYL